MCIYVHNMINMSRREKAEGVSLLRRIAFSHSGINTSMNLWIHWQVVLRENKNSYCINMWLLTMITAYQWYLAYLLITDKDHVFHMFIPMLVFCHLTVVTLWDILADGRCKETNENAILLVVRMMFLWFKKNPHGLFVHMIDVLTSYMSSLCVKQIKLYIPWCHYFSRFLKTLILIYNSHIHNLSMLSN